ncbi:MAG: hypothetical protein NW208_02510 [Bryobacter sp.]|nr:hypothetical protein [Bryobacter sp.]
MHPEIEFLYSVENPHDYTATRASVFAKYLPANPAEAELVNHIAISTWLRRRYAAAMHYALRQLHDAQANPQTPPSRVVQYSRNLVRFNREYRNQRRHISGCRSALKRLRLPSEETHEFATAA